MMCTDQGYHIWCSVSSASAIAKLRKPAVPATGTPSKKPVQASAQRETLQTRLKRIMSGQLDKQSRLLLTRSPGKQFGVELSAVSCLLGLQFWMKVFDFGLLFYLFYRG